MLKGMDREQLLKEASVAREILRRKAIDGDVWAYFLYMDTPFFTRRPFLKKIADAFQRLHDRYKEGEVYKLAISMPPRAGKSYSTSLFITFMIGQFPTESIMRNTCTATLYNTFSRATLRIIKSEKYAKVFPKVKLRDGYQNIDGWAVEQATMSSYFGSGVAGTIIGHGATMLAITDDLYRNLEDAMSETINNSVIEWKMAAHDSRLSYRTCELDVGTRWRKGDVLGILEEQGKYDEIVRIPALDENGETFCSDVKTTAQYLEMKKTLAPEIWASEYMQQPIDSIGLLYDTFKEYEIVPREPFMKSWAIVDVADTGTDSLCYIAVDERATGLYIKDIIHTQDTVEKTIPLIAERCSLLNIEEILIERNNAGRLFSIMLERALRERFNFTTKIKTFVTKINKEVRIFIRSSEVNNTVIMPIGWDKKWPTYYRELTTRSKEGGEAHDDACDATTMLTEHRFYRQKSITTHNFKEKFGLL